MLQKKQRIKKIMSWEKLRLKKYHEKKLKNQKNNG